MKKLAFLSFFFRWISSDLSQSSDVMCGTVSSYRTALITDSKKKNFTFNYSGFLLAKSYLILLHGWSQATNGTKFQNNLQSDWNNELVIRSYRLLQSYCRLFQILVCFVLHVLMYVSGMSTEPSIFLQNRENQKEKRECNSIRSIWSWWKGLENHVGLNQFQIIDVGSCFGWAGIHFGLGCC